MKLQRLKRLLQKKAVVLMYHRIAGPPTDPWALSVNPVHFEQQLQVLRSKYKVISVDELIEQHAHRTLSSRTVCITFDDGYCDNYLSAKPLLEKYGCPASFFLPTHFIGLRQPFWWDELEHIFLRTNRLPETFGLMLHQQPFHVELGEEAVLTPELRQQHRTWSAYNEPPTRRCKLYYTLWELLRPLPLQEITVLIGRIREWAGPDLQVMETALPVTIEQMHGLATRPLFTVGLHTATHPDLASHPRDLQQEELLNSIRYFQHHIDRPVRTLAYPYGRYNDDTLSLAKELHLSAAFTTFDEPVTNGSSPYQMGRFQVQNWNGKEFDLHLRKWTKTWFGW